MEKRITLMAEPMAFIKIGTRVRYLGEAKFQYQDFPKDSWVEKGITGTVDKLYSSDTSIDEEGKEFYIPEAAAVAWDKGGHSLIHADEEGKRWERIPQSMTLTRPPAAGSINVYYVPSWKEVKGIFVGGCVARGPGSSFRAKAHAHNMKEDKNFGWICVRSLKRIGDTKGNIITVPSRLLWHEYTHILTPNHYHDDVWRNKMRELGQPITEQYKKKPRVQPGPHLYEKRWCPRCLQWVNVMIPFMQCPICRGVTQNKP